MTSWSEQVVAATPIVCFSPSVDDDRAVDCDNRLRREVAAETGTRLVDLFAYICPGGHCRVTQNGVTLRPDHLHYDGPGGKIVANWLIDQVDPARSPA
jgi:hypothetical protein